MLIPLILLTAEAYTTRFGDKHQPLCAVFVAIPVVLYFGLIAAVQTMAPTCLWPTRTKPRCGPRLESQGTRYDDDREN